MIDRKAGQRAEAAVVAVLPHAARVRPGRKEDRSVDLTINGTGINVKWLGEGGLRQARELIANRKNRPDVVVARRMSPGAREAFSTAGIGWVDETGAAEIALDSLIISKSGHPPESMDKSPHWTPSVLAVAEALLCGKLATVGDIQEATGLSAGSSTNALRALVDFGLLSSVASRGRDSARQISDLGRLLDEYTVAAVAMEPTVRLAVGVTWRDFVEGFSDTSRYWKQAGLAWAATGTVAASVLAPHLTTVMTGEAYVDAETIAGLESVAARAGLRPIEGGRLTLRPFPTVATRNLVEVKDNLHLAPWPRVYADLHVAGVRGEEVAEQLRIVACRPIEYECNDLSAKVTFNIFGKKYIQELRVTEGQVLPDHSYWIKDKEKKVKEALGLLLEKHDELTNNPQIYKAIVKMQKALSDSSR